MMEIRYMLPSKKLLIVDDDPDTLHLLYSYLSARGYEVYTAQGGEESLATFVRCQPDLVILDVALPDTDGFAVCRWLREQSQLPIVFLTARTGVSDLVRGLALGADQYITKPFDLDELEARLAALLRRATHLTDPSWLRSHQAPAGADYNDGRLVVDLSRRSVTLDGQPVMLTATEFRILACLVKQAGIVVPHDELLSQVWGPEYIGDVAFLKTYIHHLRRKLRDHSRSCPYILNKWGVGYRLRAQTERCESDC